MAKKPTKVEVEELERKQATINARLKEARRRLAAEKARWSAEAERTIGRTMIRLVADGAWSAIDYPKLVAFLVAIKSEIRTAARIADQEESAARSALARCDALFDSLINPEEQDRHHGD